MSNLRPASSSDLAAMVASVQAVADYQDRNVPVTIRPPVQLGHDHSPASFGITARERGQWDRLRAEGKSAAIAANIVKLGRP